MAETKKYYYGTGRRKTAVAQVRLYPKGNGKVTVNEASVEDPSTVYLEPLKLVGQQDMDISAHVQGGGFQGQIEAIRHGVARALVAMDEEFRTSLKKAGFLTRDPRAKERKKFGLKGARRAPQWSKR
jgi:small subunit ribosomal protein S9